MPCFLAIGSICSLDSDSMRESVLRRRFLCTHLPEVGFRAGGFVGFWGSRSASPQCQSVEPILGVRLGVGIGIGIDAMPEESDSDADPDPDSIEGGTETERNCLILLALGLWA